MSRIAPSSRLAQQQNGGDLMCSNFVHKALAIEQALRGIEQANQQHLYGIFGDAQWSNKNKLSDRLLIDLIEHFSQYNLANSQVDSDLLGQSYEYLIKHFADLTNKKAGEFYTPRSVVHLLGRILAPREGETIYDPACGTGGMLLECVDHLKLNKKDYRTLKLYGQEKNLTSSSIARMNMFLHGIEDFFIVRGDTLRNPAFFEGDQLKTFDCVIANPPFSLKEWGAENWANDPFGRNIAGVPPQGNGDMAWVQHMIKSMNSTGRMTVVLPPKDYLVLCQNAEQFAAAYPEAYRFVGNFPFGLNKLQESLALYTQDGALVDKVSYEIPARDTSFTLNLLLPQLDNSQPQNWEILSGMGTPNAANTYYVISSLKARRDAWIQAGGASALLLIGILLLWFRRRKMI